MTEPGDLLNRLRALEQRTQDFERQSRQELNDLLKQMEALGRPVGNGLHPEKQSRPEKPRQRARRKRSYPQQDRGAAWTARDAAVSRVGGTVANVPRIPGMRVAYIGGQQDGIASFGNIGSGALQASCITSKWRRTCSSSWWLAPMSCSTWQLPWTVKQRCG